MQHVSWEDLPREALIGVRGLEVVSVGREPSL